MIKDTNTFIQEIEKRFPGQLLFDKTHFIDRHTDVIVTCPIHGDFNIKPKNLLKSSRTMGCHKCAIEHRAKNQIISKEQFFKQLYERYPDIDYDFSESHYIKTEEHITVICHKKDINGVEHGRFSTTPQNLYSGSGCPKCATQIKA